MRGAPHAVLTLLVLLLAGCSDAPADGPAVDGERPTVSPPGEEPLSGWVFDPALAPVVGATVSIPALAATTTVDDEGHYGLADLPYDEVLVVVVEADGYRPSSKSVTLVPGTLLRLNFTLSPVPREVAYSEALSFNGLIGCGGVVKQDNQGQSVECGSSAAVDERVWEFEVKEKVAGIVVEIVWEPGTPAAEHLNLTVETVGFGNFDEVLTGAEGPSILRGQVNQFQSKRFYSEGGVVRVTVDPGRNTADDETGTGAGFAVQQDFEAFATVFYVEPPPPGYSIAG